MKTFRIMTAFVCLTVLPSVALSASGEKLFNKKCKMCHSLEAGVSKGGPSLNNIMGKTAGSQKSFKKYKGLAGSTIVWTDENMDGWITNPKKFIGKRSTMMMKVKKPADRAAIIEFLKAH